MNTLISDHELVHEFLQGKETALEILINRHKEKIYTSIVIFVRDRALAEDIFQDTFIKVIDTLRSGNYHEEGKFVPWVMRIAHNLCVDHFRKNKRRPGVVNTEGFDIFEVLKFAEKSREDEMVWEQTSQKIKQMVDNLPDEQKEVVILRHYADLSFKEISQITGVSINTALGRMRYALQNLRKMMVEHQVSF